MARAEFTQAVSSFIVLALLSAQIVGESTPGNVGNADPSAVMLLQVGHQFTRLRGAPSPLSPDRAQSSSTLSSLLSLIHLDIPAHTQEDSPKSLLKSVWSLITRPVEQGIKPPGNMFWLRHEAWWKILLAFVAHVCLVCVVAHFYTKYRTPVLEKKEGSKPSVEGGARSFEYGLCDNKNCLEADFLLCLCSFCCLGIRWSDTLSRENIGLVSFWAGVMLWAVVSFATESIGAGIFGLLFLLAAVMYRQQLRKAFGLESGTCMTVTTDCLTWLCCPCCATAQEARQVEYVRPVAEQK